MYTYINAVSMSNIFVNHNQPEGGTAGEPCRDEPSGHEAHPEALRGCGDGLPGHI